MCVGILQFLTFYIRSVIPKLIFSHQDGCVGGWLVDQHTEKITHYQRAVVVGRCGDSGLVMVID